MLLALVLLTPFEGPCFELDKSLIEARLPVSSPWLPSDKMQAFFNAIKSHRYRPEAIHARNENGATRYQTHFVYNDDNRRYAIWWGLTPEEYEERLQEYRAKGYSLVWQETIVLGNGEFSQQAIWYEFK